MKQDPHDEELDQRINGNRADGSLGDRESTRDIVDEDELGDDDDDFDDDFDEDELDEDELDEEDEGEEEEGDDEGGSLDDEDDEELEVGTALMRLIGLLVDHPEDVRILEEVDARGETVFTVQVAPDDLGKLIGRQGRTARSLRNFLEARGKLDGHRYLLEIREQ